MNPVTWLNDALIGTRPITRKAFGRITPISLNRRSRAMARAVYVGNDTILCRVLTRYRLFVASDDVGFGVHVILDGIWEGWLTAFMAHRIKPGMAIVDAGANHGYYTLLFAHLTGSKGRVAAIEPHPRTAALLRKSLYANGFTPWVSVFECAATAMDGQNLDLRVPQTELKNAHAVAIDDVETALGVVVRGARLDTLIADWPRLDFIKIDVEGAEEACLDGAWSVLERDRPMMVLEFNASRSRDPDGLLQRLEDLYGAVRVIDRDGGLKTVARQILADATNHDDWMLYLAKD